MPHIFLIITNQSQTRVCSAFKWHKHSLKDWFHQLERDHHWAKDPRVIDNM